MFFFNLLVYFDRVYDFFTFAKVVILYITISYKPLVVKKNVITTFTYF